MLLVTDPKPAGNRSSREHTTLPIKSYVQDASRAKP